MTTTATIIDAAARACAQAIDGYVFAAGVTVDVLTNEAQVVPIADDFSEQNLPFVTVALGAWSPALPPGLERVTFTLNCAVWRARTPIGQNTAALYDDRDAIADAIAAHGRLFLHDDAVQSAVLMGGPGIVPRNIPRVATGGIDLSSRVFLTLPFTIEVKAHRSLTAAAA